MSAQLSPNDLPFADVRRRGAGCIVCILAACAVPPQQRPEAKNPRAALKCQIHPSNMQWLRIELLPRSYDLPPCDRSRLHARLFFLCRRFVLGP